MSLIGYVAYLKIKEQYLVEKVTCSNETCVRFCCISNCDFQLKTTLANATALENKTFEPIDGRLCKEKFENTDPWKFEEVKLFLCSVQKFELFFIKLGWKSSFRKRR